jgi:hypothetical protein
MENFFFIKFGHVLVGLLTSSVVDHGFELKSGQTKIGICYVCAKENEQRLVGSDSW